MWIDVISRFFRNVTTKRCAFMQFDKFLTCWRRGFVQLNLIHWFFEATNSYYFRSSLLICLRFMLLSRPLLEPDLHATADCMRNSRRNIVVSKAFSRCVNFLNKLFKGNCRPYNCRAVLSFYVTRSCLKSCKTVLLMMDYEMLIIDSFFTFEHLSRYLSTCWVILFVKHCKPEAFTLSLLLVVSNCSLFSRTMLSSRPLKSN